MKRAWISFLVLMATGQTQAAEVAPKPVEETVEQVLLGGSRAGTLTTTTVKHDTDGKQLRTTAVLDLAFRRFGSPVKVRMDSGTVETPDGKILAVFMRQVHAGGKQLILVGVVKGNKLNVKIDNGRINRELDWPTDVLGTRAQETYFTTRKPKPGDKFTFKRYDPIYNTVVTVRVVIKQKESADGTKKKLLRVELKPDKIEVPGHSVTPAGAVWWLDDDFRPVRKQIDLDGLGKAVLVRSSKDARSVSTVGGSVDIGKSSLITLNRTIIRPYDTRKAVYRVTVRDDEDPDKILVSDSHQEVKNVKGDTFELHVHPVRLAKAKGAATAGKEYLGTSHYIDHDHDRVKELARKAVGTEKDAWRKAVKIERWVKQTIKLDNQAAFAPASDVAKSPRGDCRHHAILTTALCRASDIPARTAIGLLYVVRGKPQMGFHMWTEVFINGQWLGLDSTLGKGSVSAAHIKISDHSWDKVQSLTPLLPLARVLGKISIVVVKTE